MLDIVFADDATFKVSIGGSRWLDSASIRTFTGGAWQNLSRTGTSHTTGADLGGTVYNVIWYVPEEYTGIYISTPIVTHV